MPHLSMKTPAGRRLGAAGLASAIAVGLACALWLASSPSPAGASVGRATTSLSTAASSDGDRAELRKDMQTARELTGQERKDAVKKIRADARAGAYGDKIEKRADRRGGRRAAVLALLPDQLQADLKELRSADPGERKAMRKDIRDKALDGGYGDKVEEAASKLKDAWAK